MTIEAFWKVWRFAFLFRSPQAGFSDWFYGIVRRLAVEALLLRAPNPLHHSVAPVEQSLTQAMVDYRKKANA